MNKKILLIIFICPIIFISGCTDNTGNNKTQNTTYATNNVTSTVNTTIEITDPTEGQTVTKEYIIKGKTRELKSNENLYVLVKSENYSWWVQSKPSISSDGIWECKAQFGEDKDSGIKFTVCALITTKNLPLKQEYSGILPSNVANTEISVTRS